MSPQIHPNGFRISDRPVAASFAHPESFQPISDFALKDEACMVSSMALGGMDGQWVRYWDEGSTAAILEFEIVEPLQRATAAPVKDKKEKRRNKGRHYLHVVNFQAHTYLQYRRLASPPRSSCGGLYSSCL